MKQLAKKLKVVRIYNSQVEILMRIGILRRAACVGNAVLRIHSCADNLDR